MTSRRTRIRIAAAVAAVLSLVIVSSVASGAAGNWSSDVRADGLVKVWVFFTDKGLDRAGEQAALDAFRERIPERALARRAKVGFDLNRNDLPVAERYVEAVRAAGAQVMMRSRWMNAVSAVVPPSGVDALAGLPFVREVRPVAKARRDLPVIIPADEGKVESDRDRVLDYGYADGQLNQIQVPLLHAEGYDGAGVLIAMLDTGFDTDHQAYRHLDIVAERDFINNDTETANEPGDPSGQDSHGTATLSCVGGAYPGQLYGGSYQASFILCKTEIVDEEIEAEEDNWVAAVEWADSLGADLVSSSLGYLDWYTYEDMDGNTAVTTIAADMAAARGLLVVNSMGNERNDPWHYMIAPADGDSVLSIGAVDQYDEVTYFSSAGPTYDGRIKPDVCAKGLSVYVATTSDTASYGYSSGTSFSCPLTSGAVGLLVQGHPEWGPQDIIDALRATATQSSSPDTLIGWGILQASDAMDYIGAGAEEDDVLLPRLVAARPNPASHGTAVSYTVPSSADVTVSVYDAAGRLTARLFEGPRDAGTYTVAWDGRDSSGRSVASGIYFIRMAAGADVRSSAKVVLVR